MASSSETIWTHTCDLCGSPCERKVLHRLGEVDIPEGYPLREPPKKTCDVCPGCASKPVSEVLAILVPEEDAALQRLRALAPRSA